MRKLNRILLVVALPLLLAVGCRKAPTTTTEVVAVSASQIPTSPTDPAWENKPEFLAKLIPQDLVDPRLAQASTTEVRVQAITNGSEIAFRLSWVDAEPNDTTRPGEFVDACAVQVPAQRATDLPAPQMGEKNKNVQIVYWRADWQAWVNGRGDTIKDIYPNAEITHYPFQAASLEKGSPEQLEMAKRYSPADASGNRRQGPRQSSVESLIAEGPGTLSPNPTLPVRGNGMRTKDGWSVVLVRPIPEGLTSKVRSAVAFALWQGSNKEAGARKMRSGWTPLSIQENKP